MTSSDPVLCSGVVEAVLLGDLSGVKFLVEKEESINVCDETGNTPLHIAAMQNDLTTLDYLLSLSTIRIDIENQQMQTPLFVGCKSRSTKAALKLIETGADGNICCNEFVSPLHLAVYNVELVKSLILHGALIDTKDSGGNTPLNQVALDNNGSYEVAAALLYYGADANIACNFGFTPFMHSLSRKTFDMQKLLLDYELDFNRIANRYMSILFLAILRQSPYVEDIINKGADINFALNEMHNPLYFSLKSNFDTFKLIWERCDYTTVWLNKNRNIIDFILTEDSLTINKLNCLKLIIESDKLGEIISTSSDSNMINNLVTYFNGRELEKLSDFVYLICSAGYIPSYSEVQELFFLYGYCNAFKFLRFVEFEEDIIYDDPRFFPDLPYLICHPFMNINERMSGNIAICYDLNPETVEKNIKLTLHYFNRLLGFYDCMSNLQYLSGELTDVPRLLELARDSARRAICMEKKYNINSCSSFYTVLNCLNIPSTYKKIIAFETPIY